MKYNTKSNGVFKKIYQKFRYGFLNNPSRYVTSPLRVSPNFFVIGAVRSGTTSLFHYLGQHQCITSSAYDEIGYFDDNFHLGEHWYRSLFPTVFTKNKILKKHGKFLTYDVTPFYIYNPLVVERIKTYFPNSKIIACLRNPIDRAYSNYMIELQDGDTNLSFEERIQPEIELINNKKIKLDNKAFLVDTYYNNIIARGFYAEQLKHWYNSFPKEQLLMVSSEELSKNTHNTLNKIFDFLDLQNTEINDISKKNKREYRAMKKETRDFLIELYKPHNEKLYDLIGRKFAWDI
tara:strand:- start:14004 stop:14876 length:873 start_codon:yes stop_codon:yes gene_type:complete